MGEKEKRLAKKRGGKIAKSKGKTPKSEKCTSHDPRLGAGDD